MKKTLFFLIIALSFSTYVFAQDCVIKLGVSANLVYETPYYTLSFETDINDKATIEIGASYTRTSYSRYEYSEHLEFLHEGFGITQNIKYKFFQYKDFATFASPFISIHSINTTEDYIYTYPLSTNTYVGEYQGSIFLINAGATVGLNYTFFDWFYVQADGGIGFTNYTTDIKDQNQTILLSTWGKENHMINNITGNIKIGYHFKI